LRYSHNRTFLTGLKETYKGSWSKKTARRPRKVRAYVGSEGGNTERKKVLKKRKLVAGFQKNGEEGIVRRCPQLGKRFGGGAKK